MHPCAASVRDAQHSSGLPLSEAIRRRLCAACASGTEFSCEARLMEPGSSGPVCMSIDPSSYALLGRVALNALDGHGASSVLRNGVGVCRLLSDGFTSSNQRNSPEIQYHNYDLIYESRCVNVPFYRNLETKIMFNEIVVIQNLNVLAGGNQAFLCEKAKYNLLKPTTSDAL